MNRTVRAASVGALVVAIVGVFALTAWVFWPRWLDYRDRLAFEEPARQLQPGITTDDLAEILPGHSSWQTYMSDGAGNSIAVVPYHRRSQWYYLYLTLQPAQSGTICSTIASRSVRVYRVEMPAANYRAQTKRAIESLSSTFSVSNGVRTLVPPPEGEEGRRKGHFEDFCYIVTGQEARVPGMAYQLIYANPAAEQNLASVTKAPVP
jgi:hypothetical protein